MRARDGNAGDGQRSLIVEAAFLMGLWALILLTAVVMVLVNQPARSWAYLAAGLLAVLLITGGFNA